MEWMMWRFNFNWGYTIYLYLGNKPTNQDALVLLGSNTKDIMRGITYSVIHFTIYSR